MLIKKIFSRIKSNKAFDLKYIIIEIALIFTGITLAAKYNEYQSDRQDQKFLKEVITQIYLDIKRDEATNRWGVQLQEERIEDYKNLVKNIRQKKIAVINSKQSKMTVADMTDFFQNSYSNGGYKRLTEKNINLIKNIELKNELMRYHEIMDKITFDANVFNDAKKEMRPFILKYFKNFDFYNYNYDSFSNVDEMAKDELFLNTISYTVSNYNINVESFKSVGFAESQKICMALEKEYEFLKESKEVTKMPQVCPKASTKQKQISNPK